MTTADLCDKLTVILLTLASLALGYLWGRSSMR